MKSEIFGMNIKRWFPLIGIFLLALALRVVALGYMPHFLHQDEIMNGYVGRYILQNGKDPNGNKWPILYFNNFGDYPNVVPMYLSGLYTYLLGLNQTAIRLPIGIIGSLVVFPIYGIAMLVFRKKNIALFCAFFIAIEPWHLVLSRATAENVIASTVFLFGLWALLIAIERRKLKWLGVMGFLYALSYLLYPGMRIIVPLSLLPAAFLIRDAKFRKVLVVVMALFFVQTAMISRTTWGRGRFNQTSIFSFNGEVNSHANQYAFSTTSPLFRYTTRIFDNKIVLYGREFVKQYLTYFSPQVLFTTGGHPDRYLVPDQGLLYFSVLALLILALFFAPSANDADAVNQPYWLYLLWILALSPVASALTLDEVPNVHRSALLGVMLVFVVGAAALRVWQAKLWRVKIFPFVMIVMLGEFCFFFHQYFGQAKAAEAFARYDERTILTKRLIQLEPTVDAIYLPREVFVIYYLFFTNNFNPALAGQFGPNLYLPQVDHLHFIDNDCPLQSTLPTNEKNILIVNRAHCVSAQGYQLRERILYENGQVAYNIYAPDPATSSARLK